MTEIALFSMKAEYLAGCAVTQKSLWLAMLMEQMGIEISCPLILQQDNMAWIIWLVLTSLKTQIIISGQSISIVDIILYVKESQQATSR